ncbi:uncharacterized protein LOC124896751 [Capsicum annuum]|uniref:uncharacterized protein LOC124896751 n=1 Tax=Capsicum annuum TaxID=4072 RepID=UPI001FB0D5EE|nr:uncharacterized protein LOC124896751 [Capsicum annuum]
MGKPKPTTMRLILTDLSIKKPIGKIHDVLVKVDRFIFPTDFVILDCALNHEIPIILGRPFLAIRKVLVDAEFNKMKFCRKSNEVSFNVCKFMKQPMDLQVVLKIDTIDDEVTNYVHVSMVNDPLVVVLWNCEREKVE